MWCIWQERNSRSFKGSERTILEFKAFFLRSLLDLSFLSLPCFSFLNLFEHLLGLFFFLIKHMLNMGITIFEIGHWLNEQLVRMEQVLV